MRASQYFFPTQREIPADAEIISHQLMLRAGMIRKLAAGLYTWLPLGLRVLRKVETIIREEMNRAGALELLMPTIQPAHLWQETERWDKFGPQLLKLEDRHHNAFCFGPTHEEIITDLLRREIRSYRQLPLNLYQIQTKFRDEIRPRFGIMRAREFLMKDAYSFHSNEACLAKTYEKMYQTYSRIFTRLGLNFRAVLADTGSIGGNKSHEFHVLAESGEDLIAFSDGSDYAANVELAEALITHQAQTTAQETLHSINTPDKKTVAEISQFLNIPMHKILKTLLVKGNQTPIVALLLRGDHELNPIKVEKLAEIASPLSFVAPEEIQAKMLCNVGYIGPVKIPFPCIVDHSATAMVDFICGANQEGKHLAGVNWERDLPLPKSADLRKVIAGDPSPDNKGTLALARGIEVGHIFQLGTRYSAAMQAMVTDERGHNKPMVMGCYGIGVSRIVAAAIEQNYDEKGILWPQAMAPFDIGLLPIQMHKSSQLTEACEKLYHELENAGFSVWFDDRKERPGSMFTDFELLGIPHRLVLTESGLQQGNIEYQTRRGGKPQLLALKEIVNLKYILGNS